MTTTTKPLTISEMGFTPILKHRDILAFDSGRGYERFYMIGDVWSYAAETGRDPQAAYERCAAQKDATIWANAEGVTLDNSRMTPRERYESKRVTVWSARFGDRVTICGRTFILRPDHNDNVKLEPMPA